MSKLTETITVVRALVVIAAVLSLALPALADDPGKIDVYVTPYYNSSGPVIRVGKYSAGLASKKQAQFVATILQMKKEWNRLDFSELYVGAIRLYDLGYRNEATYWFYSAQYQGRLFALLVDQKKMGGIGSPGFELYHAQDAFLQLAGPNINGYSFGNVNELAAIVRKVQGANRSVPNLAAIFPRISFVAKGQWQRQNAQLNSGLSAFATSIVNQKDQIAQQRVASGAQARFAHLTSKPFPGGL